MNTFGGAAEHAELLKRSFSRDAEDPDNRREDPEEESLLAQASAGLFLCPVAHRDELQHA